MKKLTIILNSFIATLTLIACSNYKYSDDELKKYAYVSTNFDMNILNQANKLEITVLGTSMSKPLYNGECNLDSKINNNLKILLANSDIYLDNDPIKGFDQCAIFLKYHLTNNSTISIYRAYKPGIEPQGINHSYLLNDELYYKDFYNCWMNISFDNISNGKYILDLKNIENLKKLNTVFDYLYTYLDIEFK